MALAGFCYRGVVTFLPTYLGRFSVSVELQNDLDNGILSERLRQEFSNNKMELSQNATVLVDTKSRKWQIDDEAGKFKVMKEGDKLVLYTDGVTDYRSATGEIWGEERFHGLLASLAQKPAKGLVDKVLAEMMTFGHGDRPGDDISILALEFTGPTADEA